MLLDHRAELQLVGRQITALSALERVYLAQTDSATRQLDSLHKANDHMTKGLSLRSAASLNATQMGTLLRSQQTMAALAQRVLTVQRQTKRQALSLLTPAQRVGPLGSAGVRWLAFSSCPSSRAHPSSLVFGLIALVAVSPAAAQTAAQAPLAQAPFKAGGQYFFITANGSLAVRNDQAGSTKQLLQARAYGTLAPSWDCRYVAYGYGQPASSTAVYDILILNVSSGRVSPEILHNARISRSPWTADNQGFFYTRADTGEHRERVYYHRVGTPQAHDAVIYSRPDAPEWRYDVRVSDDGQFTLFTISRPQDAQTQLYFLDLDDPQKPALHAPVLKLIDEFRARYSFAMNDGRNAFLLQTDDSAPRSRIVLAPTDLTRSGHWPAVWPERPADTLQYTRTAGQNNLVAVYRNGAYTTVQVLAVSTLVPQQTSRATSWGRGQRGMSPRGGGRWGMSGDRGRMGSDRPERSRNVGGRLHLVREIPLPAGSTLVDMWSVTHDDELLYTVQRSDGTHVSYVYNVENGQNTAFESDGTTH